MPTLERNNLYDPELVSDLFNKVRGKSSLAMLSGAVPIKFVGQKEFTFSMDKEVDIVAESGAKSTGGVSLTPVTIVPTKFEYGARVTDEFLYASEEEKIDILKAFNDGFANKLARGIDITAFHGVNPRTGEAAATIGDNCFDKTITNIAAATGTADEQVEDAIGLVQDAENDVTGIAMAPALRSALAKLTDGSGAKLYPELAWGAAPSVINGLPASVNSTVSACDSGDLAIVGDFANAFKWGYAKDITLQIIEYGNPDNDTEAGDLKGHNQIYLRAEAYVGWGILDPASFAIINSEAVA